MLDLQRYSRDQGSSIYFPQAVLKGKTLDTSLVCLSVVVCTGGSRSVLICTRITGPVSPGVDLYDITLSDGDCRLRVTLDPSLNQLVERNVLRPGSRLRNSTFAPAMVARLPECPGVSGDRDR